LTISFNIKTLPNISGCMRLPLNPITKTRRLPETPRQELQG
jgi:hypothetical protein